MSLFSRLNKIIQGKNNRNRAALETLRALGFSMPRIRKALFDLNEINIRKIGNGRVSLPTLYNTMSGNRGNPQAREILANSLGLKTEVGRGDVLKQLNKPKRVVKEKAVQVMRKLLKYLRSPPFLLIINPKKREICHEAF